ncbi:hypothetical protein A9309_05830 [Moraxella lacunata]|uniref:Uncharacterized protein n=1 Tax=Moraxella lacunata TaxID=477 RepID=A0A1B8Q312_MORLA|nr:hypothetical protein A9309_05830 [Moraxella lacunata]
MGHDWAGCGDVTLILIIPNSVIFGAIMKTQISLLFLLGCFIRAIFILAHHTKPLPKTQTKIRRPVIDRLILWLLLADVV